MKKEQQEEFLSFILEKVSGDDHGKAKDILGGAFKKQDDGEFGLDDVVAMAPKLLSLLKPEHIDEVKNVMEGFAKGFGKDK